jgi:hypothetical protein
VDAVLAVGAVVNAREIPSEGDVDMRLSGWEDFQK